VSGELARPIPPSTLEEQRTVALSRIAAEIERCMCGHGSSIHLANGKCSDCSCRQPVPALLAIARVLNSYVSAALEAPPQQQQSAAQSVPLIVRP
jgi:hypothetical protein